MSGERSGLVLDWRAALAGLEGAYAPATLQHQALQFAQFERWCRARGSSCLPASPDLVADHIDEVHPRYRCKSVIARLGAVRKVHGLFDLPDPTRGPVVRLALRRGRRAYGGSPQQARGLRAVLKAQVLTACSEDLTGLRDRAMINIAYDALCRSGELFAFRVEDLTELEDGGARLQVVRAKNDPFGEGASAFLSPDTYRDVVRWLEAAGIREGPIVRRVWRDRVTGGHMHASFLGRKLRSLAARVGLQPDVVRQLTGHSLRVGAAQDLAASGRSLLEIMCAGRWRAVPAVAQYAREAAVNVWATGGGG